MLSVLFMDNFDSFVFNLVDELARRGCRIEVWRSDIPAATALELALALPTPRLVVLSPGPGTPAKAGCCLELLRGAPSWLPFFGVCLGHQAIIEAHGGVVDPARTIVHGKSSQVAHEGVGLFDGLPSPMSVGRYHSLVGTEIPVALRPTAEVDGEVMAVEHVSLPRWGVQFHPESILTPLGGRLIDNVMRLSSRIGDFPQDEDTSHAPCVGG